MEADAPEKGIEGAPRVRDVAEREQVIFVHTVPVHWANQANTAGNNAAIDTRTLGAAERIEHLLREKPALACSTVSVKRDDFQYGYSLSRPDTMYPFGVVVGDGAVTHAYRYDGGTEVAADGRRRRKYDAASPDADVQPNLKAQIEYAIHGPFSDSYREQFLEDNGAIQGNLKGGAGWNEFGVINPETTAFFLDIDFLEAEKDAAARASLHHEYPEEAFRQAAQNFARQDLAAISKILKGYPDFPLLVRRNHVVVPARVEGGAIVALEGRSAGENLLPEGWSVPA